jgi:hypothetical protein
MANSDQLSPESPCSSEQCGVCRFWKRYGPHLAIPTTYGTCRVNPPTAAVDRSVKPFSAMTLWPDTHEADWCGKFSPVSLSGALLRYEKWKAEAIRKIHDSFYTGIDPVKPREFGFKRIAPKLWECQKCGEATTADSHPIRCGSCGGSYANQQIDKLYPRPRQPMTMCGSRRR